MHKILLTFTFLLVFKAAWPQLLRPLKDLLIEPDSGWRQLRGLIDSAKNEVEVLPFDSAKAAEALYHTQISTRAPLGLIVYRTGGVMIDGGWIRLLGSGSARLPRSVPDWSRGKSFQTYGERPEYLLVADDAIGGFFALNLGGLGKDIGAIYYLAPDNLEWESDWKDYWEFMWFCFSGDIKKYYGDYQWKGWRKEIDTLGGDRAFHIFPPLWSKEGKDINKDTRGAVPVQELFTYAMYMRKQMGIK